MPTKKAAAKPPAYTPAGRDAEERWLCNVVDGCDEVAVAQGVLQCGAGCVHAGREFTANLQLRRDELEQVDAREGAIKAAAASRAVDPHEAKDLLDVVELRALAERRKILGGEIEALDAERSSVEADHTHPLFACGEHVNKLPK